MVIGLNTCYLLRKHQISKSNTVVYQLAFFVTDAKTHTDGVDTERCTALFEAQVRPLIQTVYKKVYFGLFISCHSNSMMSGVCF